MALSKKSITGLGTLMSVAVIAISGFLVVKPSYEQAQDNRSELSTLQTETTTKTERLKVLEEGVDNYDEIQAYVDTFLKYAPANKDIESASRAISNAVVPGTNIVSFTFGSEEAATEYEVPKASIDGGTTAASSSSSSSSTTASTDASATGTSTASAGTMQRVPVEISVTSSSYENLSQYLDSLAQQQRLLTIISVASSGGAANAEGGGVSATINGYAFVYVR